MTLSDKDCFGQGEGVKVIVLSSDLNLSNIVQSIPDDMAVDEGTLAIVELMI